MIQEAFEDANPVDAVMISSYFRSRAKIKS